MKGSLPNFRMLRTGRAVRLERDERLRVMVCYYLQIVARQIGFVRAHLGHSEVASGCLNQSGELRTIVRVGVRDFDAGNDVGLRSAHQVNLDPLVSFHLFRFGVFRLNPSSKATSRKARRIDRERRFDRLQRQTASLNQLFQERGQCWIFKVTRDRIVVRRSRQESLAVRVFQVAHETASAHCRIDLERAGENHIGQGQAWPPVLLDRFFDAFAQLSQQFQKAILLVSLRSVVGSPFLLVGLLDRDRLSESLSLRFFVESKFALGHDLNRVKMLAPELPGCEIGTGAMRLSRVQV